MKLPLDCIAEYDAQFLDPEKATELYDYLLNNYDITSPHTTEINGQLFKFDFGKLMFIDTELMDTNALPQSAWGRTALWPEELKPIRNRLEALYGREFKVCVCIYYPDGNVGVDYHSDYVAFGDTSLIPSLSLGEERDFSLRHKDTREEFTLELANGSILVMGEHCQERYEHSLPLNPSYKNGRLNLTFRMYGGI